MDRKLFLSYIQNMQQNNQDLTGFQNSMRKNSWQKPRSIHEMNGEDENTIHLRDGFGNRLTPFDVSTDKGLASAIKHIAGVQLAADATSYDNVTDREREAIAHNKPHVERLHQLAKERRLKIDDYPGMMGDFTMDFGRIADEEADHIIKSFGPDQDAEEARVHALHRQGRIVNEARLRTKSYDTYVHPVSGRQLMRDSNAQTVLGALLDKNHPINSDPAHADERESIIRVLTDMGMIRNRDLTDTVTEMPGSVSRYNFERVGPSANDPTKTGPGKSSANVQDLRRYNRFATDRVYKSFGTVPTPPGVVPPTDQ